MIGTYDEIRIYNGEKNYGLKKVKDLVPRIVTFDDRFAFCLIEKHCHNPKSYYCFLSELGLADRAITCLGDTIKKLSLGDYFKTSYRLRDLRLKINLKKIIYDSNRNK